MGITIKQFLVKAKVWPTSAKEDEKAGAPAASSTGGMSTGGGLGGGKSVSSTQKDSVAEIVSQVLEIINKEKER